MGKYRPQAGDGAWVGTRISGAAERVSNGRNPMSQNDPYMPPQGGQYIPPPPQYPAGSDIPPQSPYHYSPAPSQGGSRGAIGWLGSAALAVWAVVKYGLIFAFKIPALATLLSALVSFGAYSLLYGGWFA